ncbi:MAG: UPF0280 family protein [Desulfobacterales bacterium]|nr:MAG: UPF0280 family protein [Desulfobacterales bacterium]
MYEERTYRNLVKTEKLSTFQVVVKETDLLVHAERKLVGETRELVLEQRGYIEAFINAHPDFKAALSPWRLDGPAPSIVRDMINAGTNAGVGPMAAIAGAVAEHVGLGLLRITNQVILENGGDVFIKTEMPVTVGIWAGKSPLSMQLGIRVRCEQQPVAVCTSSGTVGHSLSFGKADAVCVVADSCAVADAAATSIGNLIQSPAHINDAITAGKRIDKIGGIIIIVGNKIGIWGDLEVVPLINPPGKKG